MQLWDDKPYYSLNTLLRERFGEKVYKLALNGGTTCPNRDGTLGTRGCIFCSAGGSGDFAGSRIQSVTAQIEEQKKKIQKKRPVGKFIAYFQAYTGTYAPYEKLEQSFTEAIRHPDIAAVSIGTRPDCLGLPASLTGASPKLPADSGILDLLERLNREKPVWVELGLQTIHESTASYIRRGYPLSCFQAAVSALKERNLEVIVHTILGLPGETREDILQTIAYLNTLPVSGIKLQLLHVLKNTDLAADYAEGKFETLSREAYLDLLIACIEHLSPDIAIHRVTGDGPRDLLIAPLWSSAKRTVLNDLHHEMKVRNSWQGKEL